ncbi:RagB/SusD family nutrient uptake outer membrane protein [Fulvivirga maritima]|uniref:RagB/SusD family nutrient uptake outer membrane protein n=1 Tax=Fulvivirga maritima TaxID=2904247 RepID=UPI001F42B62C|nr:RagB/SusD family nutrient uptake outer membrane protein [Fulvivirga maritima]UII27179.1 RagB/SusD family nutrient uptake outer membrane protein [Fulvivirga maritima]
MNKYSAILYLILFTLAGCDDFLSQAPDDRTQLDTREKIGELLVDAYPEANYAPFCEAMSDNVEDNPSGSQNQLNSDSFFWRDGLTTSQDSPEFYWNACYSAVAAANHAVRAIEQADNPDEYSAEYGEALVARAYSHFMLVSLFANFYNPASADFDLGIPYVTEPETESLKTYERHTVAYVYEMIEKDLLQGLPLIDDQSYETGDATGVLKYHFTKSASNAFAVRFYLFKKDYDKVIEYAERVLGSGELGDYMRPWNTDYKSLSAQELANTYTRSTERANLLLSETMSGWPRTFNSLRFSTGAPKYQELFTNPTGGMFSFSTFYTSNGIYYINKFKEHFVRMGNNANTGYPYMMLPLFTVEEVLLSRAEAYAYNNEPHQALADLNTWISKRVDNYDPDVHQLTYNRLYNYYQYNINQQNLIAATLHFRQVEFLHEGMRWFDILRHKIPVVHTANNGETFELKAGDPRRTLQIPQEAMTVGGLSPNPR